MNLSALLNKEEVGLAATVLDYQPFILSENVQTGAAYSWAYSDDPRTKPSLVFNRADNSEHDWSRITDTNARLRTMYDDILDEVALRFPGGSLFDVACNNGYFPVGAELRGLSGTGMDMVDYSKSFSILNNALGTKAKFLNLVYDSERHEMPIQDQFDVVVASAIMCHLPDPLPFLAAIGKIAKRAILFWGQVIDTEQLIISHKPPHPELSRLTKFPHSFNDNTRISRGMFKESMRLMGFKSVIEIEHRNTWLPQFLPYSLDANAPKTLDEELKTGSKHVAFLALK